MRAFVDSIEVNWKNKFVEVTVKYWNVIPNFFYWAMNGQALPITDNRKEIRDWTYVGDMIKGLLAIGINRRQSEKQPT